VVSALRTNNRTGQAPSLSVTYCPIDRLKVNPDNPRIHSDRQIKQIARSLGTFGPIVPVLIDQNSRVIAGHGRILAARLLGLKEFPTIRLEHLSDDQLRAYSLADNKLTDNSTWDEALLGQQLKALAEVELDFSIEATGLEVGEIDVLIEGLSAAGKDDADPADVLPDPEQSVPITKLGDLWLLNRHRVLCDNSLNECSFRLLMQDRKAAMVFVDPPYNVPIQHHVGGLGAIKHREFAMAAGEMTPGEFADFLAQAFRLLARYSFDGAIHFVCGDWRHLREFLDAGYQTYSEFKNLCVWAKSNAGMGSFYRSQHELVFVWKSAEEPIATTFNWVNSVGTEQTFGPTVGPTHFRVTPKKGIC
jgi:hypothetical protein